MSFHLSSVGAFAKERLKDVWSIVDDALIDNSDGRAKGRRGLLAGNYFSTMISALIGGAYYTGLLLHMGASDVYIGYLSMIASVFTFLQLFAPLLVEHLERRKNILMVARGIMHFLNIIFLGIVPLIPMSQGARLTVFFLTVMIINLINSFSGSAFNAWHMQSLPHARRASYFTLSGLGTQVISVATVFLAGLAVDGLKASEVIVFGLSPAYFGFLLLRLIAVFVAVGEFKAFLSIPEYPYEKDPNQRKVDLHILIFPLKNKDFMKLAFVSFLWNVLAGFVGPYFSVYLLQKVEMSYTYISLAGLAGLPMALIFTPIWARLINRYSWFKMFVVALAGYLSTFFLNVFTTPSTQVIYIISCMLCYAFNPAINLNLSNIQFVKMPATNQTAFLSFYSAFVTVGSLLGTFLGTQFFTFTEGKSFMLFGLTITNYQWMPFVQAILSAILMVYIIVIRAQLRRDPANQSLNL